MVDEPTPGWPPRFTFTPEGVAGMFLLGRFPGAERADQLALAELIKEAWRAGYDSAIAGEERQ